MGTDLGSNAKPRGEPPSCVGLSLEANCLDVIVVALKRKLPAVRNSTSWAGNYGVEPEPISTDLH